MRVYHNNFNQNCLSQLGSHNEVLHVASAAGEVNRLPFFPWKFACWMLVQNRMGQLDLQSASSRQSQTEIATKKRAVSEYLIST